MIRADRTRREPSEADVKTARALSDHVNRSSTDVSGLAQELANDHPTLQQGKMRLFVAFVREMAAKPYADARNQASVDLAKKLVAGWEAEYGPDDANYGPRGPYLPLI